MLTTADKDSNSSSIIAVEMDFAERIHPLPCFQPFPKLNILDSSKLVKFADDEFKFDENSRNVFILGYTEGKEEIARYEHFSFSKIF